MTALNKVQLFSALADNTIGAILPLTMRNVIDSVELKYDNFVVVKNGNIDGNKFPDASGGKITLAANTAYFINGSVTVTSPIYLSDNSGLFSISRNASVDILLLDASAGAVALINNDPSCNSAEINGITLYSIGGTGRIFATDTIGFFKVSNCQFACEALGEIAEGDNLEMRNNICYFTGTSLTISGAFVRILFDGARSGASNDAIQYDITATTEGLSILNCYNSPVQNLPMFKVYGDATATAAMVSNNTAVDALLIEGIDETSTSFTFIGNVGTAPTVVGFSAVVDANTVATTTVSQGAWAKIVCNGEDILDAQATRFTRTSALKYTYNGIEPFNASIHLDVSAKRSTGAPDTNFSFGVFKNGALVTRSVSKAVTSITRVTTTATLTLTAAFEGLKTGQTVTISGATPSQYNGTFVITRTSSTVFTYTMASDPGASASGTILALLPIEIVSTIALHDNLDSCTVVFNQVLNTGDYIEPYLRSDDSGVINGLVQSLMLTVT